MKRTNDLQMEELLKAIQGIQLDTAFTTDGLAVSVTVHNGIDSDRLDYIFITVDIYPYQIDDQFAFYQFTPFEENLNKLKELKANIQSKTK